MIGNIIQIVSLVAVAATIYFASLQTKGLREQVRISNLVSRYETLGHASERYDVGLQLLFQRPDLRPYIFERKSIDLTGDDLARVLIIADLMAGAADYAVRVGSRFPDDAGSDWAGVAQAMMMQPVFQKLALERPYEFPDLIKFFEARAE